MSWSDHNKTRQPNLWVWLLMPACFLCAVCVTRAEPIGSTNADEPQEVTVCQLKDDPGKYNRMVIRVTAFVSHGFEDFGLFDPHCSEWPDVWLEYGGTRKSGTMYCCGVTASLTRPKAVTVENIPIPLLADTHFQTFDHLIQSEYDTVLHATIIGRFFSGKETEYPGGKSWGGYGHMGCCSLLMVQQILAVDPHDRTDLDYGAAMDQPRLNQSGCGYRFLLEGRHPDLLALQTEAEAAAQDWKFLEPERVAKETLASSLKLSPEAISEFKQTRQAAGRFVYEWLPKDRKPTYMVVVSKPYLLSFFARDTRRIPWVVTAAYEASCEEGNDVTVLKAPPIHKQKRRVHRRPAKPN